MIGILGYGAYLPRSRFTAATKNWQWPDERAVANFDEDTVTMAVAAARDCLPRDQQAQIQRLFLASTSAPYSEKQAATIVATAADLPTSVLTVDIAHSLRGATTALRLALDGAGPSLVVAADHRFGQIGSQIERSGGAGGAALLLGEGAVLATVVAASSVSTEVLDTWRLDGETVLRVAPERFRADNSIHGPLLAAVEKLEQEHGLKASEVDHVALAAPDSRRHRDVLRRIGLPAEQSSALLPRTGNAGAAQPLLELVAALERAAPGERILLLAAGDGADAIILEATDALVAWRSARRPLLDRAGDGTPLPDYLDYLRWRGILPLGDETAPPAHGPAPAALYRQQHSLLRFHGGRCGACGMLQYPPQRVCTKCQTRDQMDPVPLADVGATLFSYSLDRIAGTPDLPLVHGVVDFDGGGRAVFQITDRSTEEMAIGLRLAPTLRKLGVADGVHPYLWKMTPAREEPRR